MLISCKWLKTLVDAPTDDLKAFCNRLDLTGTGVEAVNKVGANLDGIYVGHILTREKHPDADTLWVTTVDVGAANVDDEGHPVPLHIVCGAQNFVAGDKVPVATIGTTMPDGTKIKKSKLRGIESCGMNCSGRELGISADHSGLLILPEDAPVGTPIATYLGLSDTVIDTEITPNRPDCLSMQGIAREVGAMYALPWHPEVFDMPQTQEDVNDSVQVKIDDPVLCPRYTARLIRNVSVGPSPDWLAERVTAAGSHAINNIVDVTNYIMFSLGQPLHAFDYDKLPRDADGKVTIEVRAARDGEHLLTLDGVDRVLTSDMTVITDGSKPIALAGVMGGMNSEIDENTRNVLLESAAFSTSHTSRTSRNLSLISESSLRYERGVDPNGCECNSAQAASLIASVSHGTLCGGVIDEYPLPLLPVSMKFRIPRFDAFVGEDVPADVVRDTLERLGCTVEGDGDTLDVTAPTFRPDLTREIDLYEEVLRLWGMDRVTMTLPGGRGRIGGRTEDQRRCDMIGEVLRSCGLNETMTYSFVPADDLERLRMPEEGRGESVVLLNPMSSDQAVMRRSIVPGLLRSIAYNESHGTQNIQLYEIGRVFAAAEGRKKPKERKLVTAVMSGSWNDESWNEPARALDFFDAKGVISNLLRELCTRKVRFTALSETDAPFLQPGRAAQVTSGGTCLGWVGEVHPLALAAFDVKNPVVAFELDLAALLSTAQEMRDYVDVPRFPAVDVDLALVMDEAVTAEKVENAIRSAGGNLLSSVRLFDVYRDDEHLGAGRKSMAFSLSYRASDRTLSADEVEKAHERLVRKVCGAIGAEVRG